MADLGRSERSIRARDLDAVPSWTEALKLWHSEPWDALQLMTHNRDANRVNVLDWHRCQEWNPICNAMRSCPRILITGFFVFALLAVLLSLPVRRTEAPVTITFVGFTEPAVLGARQPQDPWGIFVISN